MANLLRRDVRNKLELTKRERRVGETFILILFQIC